jgi:hypothetical protein
MLTVVVLDCPEDLLNHPHWDMAPSTVIIRRYAATNLMELLERGRPADILVTTALPLRREVLDYITRPKHILVPAARADMLVEGAIARQLGLQVHPVNGDWEDGALFVRTLIAGIAEITGS